MSRQWWQQQRANLKPLQKCADTHGTVEERSRSEWEKRETGEGESIPLISWHPAASPVSCSRSSVCPRWTHSNSPHSPVLQSHTPWKVSHMTELRSGTFTSFDNKTNVIVTADHGGLQPRVQRTTLASWCLGHCWLVIFRLFMYVDQCVLSKFWPFLFC